MAWVYVAGWALFGVACIEAGAFVVTRSRTSELLGWLAALSAAGIFGYLILA